MIELILKKKLLLVTICLLLFIFAFGFLGTMFVFKTPDKIYKTPTWPAEDNEYCSDPAHQKDDFIRCSQIIRRYEAPSLEHLLGLDDLGRDELSRLAWGTRHSLEIGLVASIIITILAILFGAVGGYIGGMVDEFSSFVVNLFIVLPVIPILVFIAYLTQEQGLILNITLVGITFIDLTIKGHLLIAVIIAFTNWGWAARSIRSQVLSLKERNFINMAKVSGMNPLSISLNEILPNMFSYITLVFAISLGISIASEAGLSVLGIGVPTDFPTLGTLLYWGRVLLSPSTYMNMMFVFLPPGLIITIFFVLLYIMQAEMDEIFNPRLRKG